MRTAPMMTARAYTITVIIMYDVSGQTDYPPPHRDLSPVPNQHGSLYPCGDDSCCLPAKCVKSLCTRNDDGTIEHSDRCRSYTVPPAGRRAHIAGCDERHAEFIGCLLPQPDPPAAPPAGTDPPTDWLMVWMSGYLAGYATGYDHGHDDGEREYGETLADALAPMRRAAAHGIDVAIARGAWQEQQRRMKGGGA